jgi:hypothetical protein
MYISCCPDMPCCCWTACLPGCCQDYCINREQWDFVLDITKFKSKASWAAEPTEGLESKVKSAFTRKFNQQVRADAPFTT